MHEPMIPTYRYSVVSSPMSIDLNEDHTHTLFSTIHQVSSSSSSLSTSILFNPDQAQGGFCYCESKHLQEAQKIVCFGGSCDHQAEKIEKRSDLELRLWEKEECDNLQGEDSSTNWMPPKMRMVRKIMVSDQTGSHKADISNSKQMKAKEKNPTLSQLVTDDSNYNSSSNNNSVTARVCADCHTTKTPLWRTGPTGPKSLCNACGIRQRKARRAIAAAATTAKGTNRLEAKKSEVKKGKKLHSKGKKPKTGSAPVLVKKKRKPAKHRKKFSAFEDLSVRFQQVFPQDEKEAAILLMALSHGLLHGFPSDRYIS
ncbi:GATA transcription factor 21 [Vigna radiata var. radiata]|uniref:GATA transcription factor 21 n=1 Tax=Vigna radiata var. radiata TaxID=3916 RepID=A0A1S3U1T2_VIGRR|nr:GATA transcription factor 21 [Vigna radiata var. radiata]